MVVRENESSQIIKHNKSVETLDKSKCGKLIWPKFYGPSMDFKSWKYDNKIISLSVYIGFVAIILTSVFLFIITGMVNYIGLIISIGCGFFLPITYWQARRREEQSQECYYMGKRGDLDWDLYENGMLERNYSDESANHIREDFDYFSNYPIVYFNIGEWNVKTIWDHVRIVAQKARDLDGAEYDKDYFDTWDEDRTEFIKSNIWFFDAKDGQEDFELDRDWLKDSNRFETILRQKIKKVI